jgi:D-alanyl-D-alanine carboxypeptidase
MSTKTFSKKRILPTLILSTFLLSLISLISSCGWEPSSGDPFPTLTQKKMEAALEEVMTNYNIPGAVVGVWYPDTGIWIKLQGYANVESESVVAKNDLFRIGSLTQTFTATVVLQLVAEGELTLDDTLESFKLSLDVPKEDIITVRQLLNHTSGLYDYTDDEDFQAQVAADPTKVWAPSDLVNIAISHTANFPPGSGFEISNTNYILLGLIVQKLTFKTMAYQIRNRIVTKLDLTNTVLPSEFPYGTYASGYVTAEDGTTLTDVTDIDPSVGWASSGMVSILTDLKTWAKALGTGSLLSSDMFAKQTDFPTTGDYQYGLGIMYAWGFYGYYGDFEGYSAAMFYLPASDGTIIVLFNKSNSSNAALELFQDLAKIVFPDQFPEED